MAEVMYLDANITVETAEIKPAQANEAEGASVSTRYTGKTISAAARSAGKTISYANGNAGKADGHAKTVA